NKCVPSTCPKSCNSDLDCLKADCGSKNRCIQNECVDSGGVSQCQPPNLVLILDKSGSMQGTGSAFVNTGQSCSQKAECLNLMKNQTPSYTPKYDYDCQYDANKGGNTCRFTRWDVAAAALMRVVTDYGGTAANNYRDRKVRFGLVLFDSNATLSAPIYRDPPAIVTLLAAAGAGGGTNYTNAFTTTKNHLNDSLSKDPVFNRKSAVLFVTDGYPGEGCNGGTNQVQAIYSMKDKDGKEREIKTYVVGFGTGLGQAGEDCLTDLARAGKTNKKKCNTGRCLEFYAADSAASLADAIQDIVNQATKEECDGLDNDCDGIIDNNAGGDCACVKSFSRPTNTSQISKRSEQHRAGVRLYTFIAAFDVQGYCPATDSQAAQDVKAYNEACRNDPEKATACIPSKASQTRPSSDAFGFYCNRCCGGTGVNTCSWPTSHACQNVPWATTGSCVDNCTNWCRQKKQVALNCIIPRGMLRRSGTGYDANGKLTVLTAMDFGADVLNKQKERWLFVNLPNIDHRKKSVENRPIIAGVNPSDYDLPTLNGTTWSLPSNSGWGSLYAHKFDSRNPSLTAKMMGIDKNCGKAFECDRDKDETIWTIVGYNNSGTSYRTYRLGAIYHSTPAIAKAPTDILPDPGYQAWLQTKIPAGSFQDKKVTERPTVVYVGSNDGVLHAFHADTGIELWGVVPATILSRLRAAVNGVGEDKARVYTVDGTPLVQDIQLYSRVVNGVVESKWMTILVVGFRAGGRGYLALDVTNPYRPRILWEINNESDKDPTDAGQGKFDRLGYTYGQPFLASVLVDIKGNGKPEERAVAILPGGVKLNPTLGKLLIDQNETNMGAVVYIVDVETGTLLRELTAKDMRGIAGTPVGFGLMPAVATKAFVGDVIGNLYRIDLNSTKPLQWKIEKFFDKLWDQGETPKPIMTGMTLAMNQRGELVLFGGTGDTENINFVSGFNKVFSIREKVTISGGLVSSVEAIPNYITKLDKYLTHENDEKQTPGPEVTIKSPNGERLTGPPIVFNGTAYFTSYTPSTQLPICGIPGHSRVYGIHFDNQCTTDNCFNALKDKNTNHFYHQVLGYADPTLNPLACCEKDGACNMGSTQLPDDNTFRDSPTSTCSDLHYTVPMLQDSSTAQPYQYHRYMSLGANTLAMGVTFTYNPGETEVTRANLGAGVQGHNFTERRPGSYFLSFQVAGRNPASSDKYRLDKLRAVQPSAHDQTKDGNYTTLGLAQTAPPVIITSWGAVLE
ncbi:MAG: VWA domain-containing protein, partial [Deltaproteobacteria bacterium]